MFIGFDTREVAQKDAPIGGVFEAADSALIEPGYQTFSQRYLNVVDRIRADSELGLAQDIGPFLDEQFPAGDIESAERQAARLAESSIGGKCGVLAVKQAKAMARRFESPERAQARLDSKHEFLYTPVARASFEALVDAAAEIANGTFGDVFAVTPREWAGYSMDVMTMQNIQRETRRNLDIAKPTPSDFEQMTGYTDPKDIQKIIRASARALIELPLFHVDRLSDGQPVIDRHKRAITLRATK